MAHKGYMARIEVPDAVVQWLEATRLEGRQEGHKEGYQKGWDEATAALVEAARAKRSEGGVAPPGSGERPHIARIRADIENGAEPAAETEERNYTKLVMGALAARPGMRAMQIVDWILERDSNANRNSILTAIKRLKKPNNKRIRQHSLRLYLVQSEEQREAAE
jgi:flagellar biosynthesis/type III secretory pathway protein FliH